MAAYLIVNVRVTDPERYREYVSVVPPTIAAFGGRFLVRAGRAECLEGTIEPRRVVILEFPTYEKAKAWWESQAYAAPKALRQSASFADMILVEGVAEGAAPG